MIEGSVNSQLEAVIQLPVYGTLEQEQQIEAIVDTGYTGSLTLPSIIATLGLPFRRRGRAEGGDVVIENLSST